MRKTLEELVKGLNDRDLESCFNDINEYYYGVLPKESKVRELINIFNDECNTNLPIYVAIQYFLFEMARRYYQNK